ncbi:MAG TPA: invasin domain 3-containing protein [Thermoanaerobaculia bacterium]|nr:invasin domain 3-containing protein [Thermoanaerobaculia bacterium]
MKKKYALALALLVPVSVLFAAACDKASPVAPSGTVLTLSVSPSQITANGTATVLVTALKPNGTPVNPGTQIRFSTTLGTIDPVAETGADGAATAILRGTGEIGTATVSARAGTTEAVTTEVEIGRPAGSVSLQANPSQIDEEGGSVRLLAVVRDATGEPLANAAVNFQSEAGTLNSGGSVLRTNASGEVTDTLRLTPEDVAALPGDSFTVQAVSGGASGNTLTDSSQIRISRCRPTINFTASNGGSTGTNSFRANIEAVEVTGQQPLTFEWDKDNDGLVDSTSRNPGFFEYQTAGPKTITVRVSNACDTASAFQTVTVGALDS